MEIKEMQRELARKDLERNGFTVEMRKAIDKIANKKIAIANKQRQVAILQNAIEALQDDIEKLEPIAEGKIKPRVNSK